MKGLINPAKQGTSFHNISQLNSVLIQIVNCTIETHGFEGFEFTQSAIVVNSPEKGEHNLLVMTC